MPTKIKQLRVPLTGEDIERFEHIKKQLGIQSDTDTVRFILKRWEDLGQKVLAK